MEINYSAAEEDEDDEEEEEEEEAFEEEKENKIIAKAKAPVKRATTVKSSSKPVAVNKATTPVKRAAVNRKFSSIEKVRLPEGSGAIRRVGLSRAAPIRPLSPVKILKFD